MSSDDDGVGPRPRPTSGKRLCVFIGETDQWNHRPLYAEIVHRAHRSGLAGASVLHGIEGFGASKRMHSLRLLSLAEDLPCLVVIIDTAARIDAFLPQVEEIVTEGLIVLDDVEVIRRDRSPGPS
jgi:uncharacterized protein